MNGGGFEWTGADLPTVEPVLARQLLEGDVVGLRYQGRKSADGRTWVADS